MTGERIDHALLIEAGKENMILLGDDLEVNCKPVVTNSIILLCCLVLMIEYFGAVNMDWFLFQHGFVSLRFTSHFGLEQLSTMISSIFLHADFFHLLGNMWILFIFGDNVEEHFGHINYLVFFIACGIAGCLVHLLCNPTMTIPAVGASGAIAGVLGAYLLLHPYAKIKTWLGDDIIFFGFRTYTLPAWMVILGWFVLQYFMLYLGVEGVGWQCHIGGFTAGMLIVMFFHMFGVSNQRAGISRVEEIGF